MNNRLSLYIVYIYLRSKYVKRLQKTAADKIQTPLKARLRCVMVSVGGGGGGG